MKTSHRNTQLEIAARRGLCVGLFALCCAAPLPALAADEAAAPAAAQPAGQTAVDPELVLSFVKGARFGQEQTVKSYLDRELPVDVTGDRGDTALIAAAGAGHKEIVKMLLNAGADPKALNIEGRSALMAAALRGDETIIKMLLDAGADVKVKDQQNETALFDAVRYGHAGAVKLLLGAGADPNIHNQRPVKAPDNGYTPLMYAARRGVAGNNASVQNWNDLIEALLEKGADPNARNSRGATALGIAQDAGYLDAVKLLLAGGAKEVFTYAGMNLNDALLVSASNGDAVKVIESLNAGADPHAASRAGVTPLMAAAYGGNVEAVRALVERGAHVNYVPNGFRAWTWTGAKLPQGQQALAQSASIGDTALIIAARLGHRDVVAYLLDHGADPALANPHGDSPLAVAAEQGHAKIASLILAKGVDPDEGRQSVPSFTGGALVGLKAEEHNTPLMKAAQGGHIEAVRVLLDAESDPNIRGLAGKTALYWAVERGYGEVVSLLLERGADPDIKTDAGFTALMEAAKNGRADIVRPLLAKHAEVDAREGGEVLPGTLDTSGGAGMTALMFAAVGGHADVVNALLDAGADISLRNRNGQTVIDEAEKSGHEDIARLLRGGRLAGR